MYNTSQLAKAKQALEYVRTLQTNTINSILVDIKNKHHKQCAKLKS